MTARRDFLAFTAGAVVAKTVLPLAARAAPVHPDAELLSLCSLYIDTEQAERATYAAMTEAEAQAFSSASVRALFSDEVTGNRLVLQQIGQTPARTAEGIKAKADALVWLYGGNADRMPYELRQEDVLFSLLRDITGRAKA